MNLTEVFLATQKVSHTELHTVKRHFRYLHMHFSVRGTLESTSRFINFGHLKF